jgi:hypothetical protein
MPPKPLSANDRNLIAVADAQAVRNALAALKGRPVPPWLRPANPFQDGSLPRDPTGFAAVTSQDLLEVTAVRGPHHAIDGWGYVGRALNALIGGDAHAARHLAYYGALRGALSILASSGIGIFNSQNAVIDAAGDRHDLSRRATHDMCWAAISAWATLPSSTQLILSCLRLNHSTLEDLQADFFAAGTSAAAGDLLRGWGFDLAQGADDRDERNWSSYQPTALNVIRTRPQDDTEFLVMFWEALRPERVSLERHLLRILLENTAAIHGSDLRNYRANYERLDEVAQSSFSFEFLTRADEPDNHPFIVHAANTNAPAHPYSMICRAALLLRLATAIAEASLIAAHINPTIEFQSWWEDFGTDHGLWKPGSEPALRSDLWSDVEIALESASTVTSANRHEWLAALSISGSTPFICQTERVALWGLFQ